MEEYPNKMADYGNSGWQQWRLAGIALTTPSEKKEAKTKGK